MRYMSIYFFILLSFFIVFKDNTYAYAEETANSNITTSSAASIENNNTSDSFHVSTADEFIQSLSNGHDIILDNNISLNIDKKFNTDTPISIDANGYGIALTQNNQVEFNGPFKFFGGSNANPIFKGDAYTLLTLNNVFLDIDNDNAVGIYDDNNFFINLYNCSISVNGNYSIGIDSKMNIDSGSSDLNFNKFSINGDNSTGIKSTKKVNIFFSELNCSGKNSELVDAPEVILDFCNFDNIPDNCTVITRQAVLMCHNLNYQAAVNGNKADLIDTVTFVLKDKSNQGFPNRTIDLNVLWNDDANYNKIGQYVIKGQVINPYPKIYAEDFPDVINATISVKDPDVLDITHIQSIDTFYDTYSISIDFLKPHSDSEDNILYCSADNGKTWKKYYDEENGCLYDFDSTQLRIYYLEFDKDYLFQYILADGTKSNILKINVNSDGTYISSAISGDRDSGDLGSNTPTSLIPPDNNSHNSNNDNNNSNINSNQNNNTNNNTNNINQNINPNNDTININKNNNTNINAININQNINTKSNTSNNIKRKSNNSSSNYIPKSNSIDAETNKSENNNSNIVIMNSDSETATFTNGTLEEQKNTTKNVKVLSNSAADTNLSISSKNANTNDVSSKAVNSSESFSNYTESTASGNNDEVTSNTEINKESNTNKEDNVSNTPSYQKKEDVLNNETPKKEADNSNYKSYGKIIALGTLFITFGISTGTFIFIKKRKL